jgi:3-methyladenine DNA glycosylase AlkD
MAGTGADALKQELRDLADESVAQHSLRFFKTGKGEYGEGDRFLGIRVPELRKRVKQYPDISTQEISTLLGSEFHEERLLALLMLIAKFQRSEAEDQKKIYALYLHNTKHINSWDLVDSSAEHIVGAYLQDRDRKPIYGLARSKDLWERRISIIATFHFIKNREFDDALRVS